MGQKRTKTKYKNIYYNEDTRLYDVKYNYKVYNALKGQNEYKSKWKYNISTITQAKEELAKLQLKDDVIEDKEITLQGIFDVWKNQAQARNFSPTSIRNTTQQFNMICNFLNKDTKLKDITEDVYYKFSSDCREYGYAEETLHSINATFRKFINLAYKKKLIKDNFLHKCENIRTEQKDDYKMLTKDEFDEIDIYFKTHKFVRLGRDNYPTYRFLFTLLYYTGIRIGEALALTFEDFEHFDYYRKGQNPNLVYVPSSNNLKGEHLQGMRVSITKAYLSDIRLIKCTKNYIRRTVPLHARVERLYIKERDYHLSIGGNIKDKIFNFGHSAVAAMLNKCCKDLNLPKYTCHEFRHTFISNLISYGVPLPVISKVSGDTQETILKRYSHLFENDEFMLLQALASIE